MSIMEKIGSSQITAEDMARSISMLEDITRNCKNICSQIQNVLEKVNRGEMITAKGISFLEVKNQLMLSYMTNMSQLLCTKIQGHSIEGLPAIGRLVEIRTVLEKMRPIDQKLKYQVDKLVKAATMGIGEHDPLKFKPDADGLVSKLAGSEDEESSEDEDGDKKAKGKYRPPKVTPMRYDGDDTVAAQQEQALEKAKKRALSTSIMNELKAQYSEAPEEVKDDFSYHRMKEDKKSKERTIYEENYFSRLSVSKQDKHKERQMRTMSGLDSLTHFGDISALSRDKSDHVSGPPSKKRKASAKTKVKKGSKGRRKFNLT